VATSGSPEPHLQHGRGWLHQLLRVRWIRRSVHFLWRNNLTFGLVFSAFAVYCFLIFALVTIYRDIGASDDKFARDALRSELYDFLLHTGREVDGTSILDNPRDFSAMRRELSIVALRKSFFTYPLTKANARSFRLANMRIDLPRGCLLEFPVETSGGTELPGVHAIQACFAIVPGDSTGNYVYFALQYPSTGVAPYKPGRSLDVDGFEVRFTKEGRPVKRIRVVYEGVTGLPRSRSLPGRYDGVFNLVPFPDDASRPTTLVSGQAIERIEEGDTSRTMTILGRIDGSLLELPMGYGTRDEFLAIARTLRLGVTVKRNGLSPFVVLPTTKGVAKASLEQAYRISVRENARLTIELPGVDELWWSSSNIDPVDLREGASPLERLGNSILALLANQGDRPSATKEVSIPGKGNAVASLSLREARIPEFASLAIGFLIAAFLGLTIMVLLLRRSFVRLTQLTHEAYAIAKTSPAARLRGSYWTRRSQIGTLWRAVSILLRREMRRLRELHAEAAEHAKTSQRERDALRWIGHRIRNPLQSLLEQKGMPEEAGKQMAALQRALDGLGRLSDIDDSAQMVRRHATSLDIATALRGYVEAKNLPPENPVDYSGPAAGVFVLFEDVALEEILDTLVENAVRHRQPWTPIVVSLEVGNAPDCVAPMATVRVFNEGEPFDDPARAFESGYTKGEHGGQGLGLYMVRTYCTQCNGEAFAENTKDGAAVVLRLPLLHV
jgi:signal transduction histidine kinase